MGSKNTVRLKVNGKEVTAEVESRLLLVDFLRRYAGTQSVHMGCDTSNCGACTVVMDGRAVKSCSILTVQADGASILTVEGLTSKKGLNPLQKAFNESQALQCGFCTPGMLMSTYALLLKTPRPEVSQIREALSGNLCRCTGYLPIIEAIRRVSENLKAERMEISDCVTLSDDR